MKFITLFILAFILSTSMKAQENIYGLNHFPLIVKYESHVGESYYYSISNICKDTLKEVELKINFFSFTTYSLNKISFNYNDRDIFKKTNRVIKLKKISPGEINYVLLPALIKQIEVTVIH